MAEKVNDKEKDILKEENSGSSSGATDRSESKSKSKKSRSKKQSSSLKNDERLIHLEEKLQEVNDKYLRLYSEFDNFRKRTLREKTEMSKTASEDLIIQLLPVIDDFERALKSMDESNIDTHTIDGIKLIYNKFYGVLKQKGLEPIQATGEPFDVDFHDAMTNIPAPSEDMKGKVVDEIEKGYTLNGKVIRYSKVVVGN
jgi:molecular chaperone GrpE